MIRTALASLFALALAGAAQAYQPIGGGSATLSGGGDDMRITYSSGGAGGGARYEQLGRSVTFADNSGGDPSWIYGPAPASDPGRAVRLIGGGDDAQVVDDRNR